MLRTVSLREQMIMAVRRSKRVVEVGFFELGPSSIDYIQAVRIVSRETVTIWRQTYNWSLHGVLAVGSPLLMTSLTIALMQRNVVKLKTPRQDLPEPPQSR